MTLNRNHAASIESSELLGELHPLIEQLGSLEGLFTLDSMSATLRGPRVESQRELHAFLQLYQKSILFAVELPAIHRAFFHAGRNELRELIALDRGMAGEPMLQELASASRRVGQCQLKRLRPLRDQRVVQRYLQAVEAGNAQGWHTVVYGVTLALYSLPLRQGLLTYAHQTLRGFIQAAALGLRLSERQSFALLDQLCATLPAAVEQLLQGVPVVEKSDPAAL